MPRSARLDAPGVFHHVIIRGIERRNIFRDNKDREAFLNRLGSLLAVTKTTCYGWALLSNHAHFLLRSGQVPLATVMRRLLTGYVVAFNRRHKRNGQLLRNRYKSIVCQEDRYLKELVRYIHLNPVRAGIILNLEELNTYPYCGHSAIVGQTERSWQDVNYVLGYFGRTREAARRAYLFYMQAGLDQGHREELVGGGLKRSLGGWSEVKKAVSMGQAHMMSDERILGESDFVDAILSQAKERYERGYELKIRGYDLHKVARRVAEVCGMEAHEVLSKGRQQDKVRARSILCFWAVRELGMPLADVARTLEMSMPGVGYAVERGKIIAQNNNYRLID
jgi:REP element-mobilizing transposase RayT